MIAMCFASIAEPVRPSEYRANKLDMSDAYSIGMPYYYGVEPVMPDLIYWSETPGASGASTLSAKSSKAKAETE